MKKTIIKVLALATFSASTLFASENVDKVKDYFKAKDYPEAVKYIKGAIADKPKDEELFAICGDIYYELGMPDSAMIMYRKAVDLDNSNEYKRKLARTYSDLKKHTEAIELINKAIKEDKKDPKNFLALGQAYIKADSLSKADLEIRKAQKMDEKSADGYLALADLYFAQKVYELAEDNYKKALDINPKLTDARINLASSYYMMARKEEDKDLKNIYYSNSLSEWEVVAAQDPKNAKAFWEAGKIYYFSELWENAAKYLNKYIQLRPDNSTARYYLVESLYRIKQCDLMNENIEIVAREVDSVKTKVKVWQAECYYTTQKYPKAIELYNNLKSQNVLNAEHLENLSKSYLYGGDTVNAINSYKDVMKLDAKRPSLMSFGILAFTMKDYRNAAAILQARESNIQDTLSKKMRYYLGIAYLMSDLPDNGLNASKVFEKVVAEDPSNYPAIVYLSDAYMKMNAKDSAITVLEGAIEKIPAANESNFNNANQKLCSIYLNDKSYKEMNKVAKAWTEKAPNSQAAYFFLGVSCHATRDKDGACRNYRKVISIDPKTELANNARKQLNGLNCGE
jgi:tetratricopeptide (TPR) repeat protein